MTACPDSGGGTSRGDGDYFCPQYSDSLSETVWLGTPGYYTFTVTLDKSSGEYSVTIAVLYENCFVTATPGALGATLDNAQTDSSGCTMYLAYGGTAVVHL